MPLPCGYFSIDIRSSSNTHWCTSQQAYWIIKAARHRELIAKSVGAGALKAEARRCLRLCIYIYIMSIMYKTTWLHGYPIDRSPIGRGFTILRRIAHWSAHMGTLTQKIPLLSLGQDQPSMGYSRFAFDHDERRLHRGYHCSPSTYVYVVVSARPGCSRCSVCDALRRCFPLFVAGWLSSWLAHRWDLPTIRLLFG